MSLTIKWSVAALMGHARTSTFTVEALQRGSRVTGTVELLIGPRVIPGQSLSNTHTVDLVKTRKRTKAVEFPTIDLVKTPVTPRVLVYRVDKILM